MTEYILRTASTGDEVELGKWSGYSSWIAESAGGLVGYLAYRIVAGEGEILHVEVKPNSRRRGVGRALIAQVMAEARVWHLEVREGNMAAREMYKQVGFVEVGRRPGYYADGETAVLMSWGL